MLTDRAIVRYPVAAIVALHGLIHLMGFVTTWELAEIDELDTSTLFDLEPGTGAAQAFGLAWLAAAVLFVIAAGCLVRPDRWDRLVRPVAGVAAVISLVVTVVWWDDALVGAVVSAVVLTGVVAWTLGKQRSQARSARTPGESRSAA